MAVDCGRRRHKRAEIRQESSVLLCTSGLNCNAIGFANFCTLEAPPR
jgi:hypothetical protein